MQGKGGTPSLATDPQNQEQQQNQNQQQNQGRLHRGLDTPRNCANGTSDLPLRLKPPAVRMVPGVWLTARPCHWLFPLLTSTRSVFLGCWTRSSLTELNRRMRTRMYGGVAGASGRPLPLCRLVLK